MQRASVAIAWEPVAEKAGPEAGLFSPTSGKNLKAGAVPTELRCAINGHLMRDPVRRAGGDGKAGADGPAFERATIELWMSRNGKVSPIRESQWCHSMRASL